MTEGYIAVVLPKLHEVNEELSALMDEADYEILLSQHQLPIVALQGDNSG